MLLPAWMKNESRCTDRDSKSMIYKKKRRRSSNRKCILGTGECKFSRLHNKTECQTSCVFCLSLLKKIKHLKKEKVKTKRDKWSQGEGCKQLEPHNDDRTNDQSDVESSASNATLLTSFRVMDTSPWQSLCAGRKEASTLRSGTSGLRFC